MDLTSRATDLQPRRGSVDHPPLDLRADVLRQLAGHAQDLLRLAAVHGKRNVWSDAAARKVSAWPKRCKLPMHSCGNTAIKG
jgi:hypothetical protein